MRKKLGIILVSILVAAIAIGGGTWHHMEKVKQEKKEEAIEKREEQKLIKKSAQQIDDFYKWNYIGVKKTTTGKLWTNPASGELELDYTVYLDSGSSDTLNAEWDKKGNILLLPYSKDVEKNHKQKYRKQKNIMIRLTNIYYNQKILIN
ncbi:hypothetical protein [Ligilactobacillus acidipiscis]|uniref:hypothetical protein n=1 Tax=Ligilactobacillus acidipiscis TaxID=89059 RepID=UPI0023F7B9B0|nr:hypothetical protein [Ligilactobacillus acidipiscis]WEV56438.1 hypothetical protein OZX66_09420 [Ligilactobacillus acidipiscis]